MLGAGGMAEVYLAKDEELGRLVAVKLVHARHRTDGRFRERLAREAKAAARLTHPNIVPVFDLGEAEGAPYIAMEFVEGRNLKEHLRRRGRLSPKLAVDYTRQILAALGYAHAHGIIHRDVKPQNILVTEDNRLKLTDFGIAKAVDSELTETGSLIGTADYLSPEQILGGPATRASDLYAVGVVLYELLTGELPFSGETPLSVALKHAHEQPTPPSQVAGDGETEISAALEQVVLCALAKAPAERYESADDFAGALAEAATGLHYTSDSTDETTATLPIVTAPTQVLVPSGPAVARRPPPRHPPPSPPAPRMPRKRPLWPWVLTLALAAAALALVGGYAVLEIDNRGQAQSETGGVGTVTVPSTVGLSEQEAVRAIEALGLQAVVETSSSEEIAVGFVVSQTPEGGAQIGEGQTVTIVVSTGNELLKVPRVIGLTAQDAVDAITSAGFVAETVESHSQEPVGLVVSQNPRPGSRIEEGASITITVSTGPEAVPVPDVVGQDEESARVALESTGFSVEVVTAPSESQAGIVVEQTPGAGSQLESGATVTLTVSSGPATIAVPGVTGQSRDAAERTLRAAGFGVEVLGKETSGRNLAGIVLDQDPRPGVRVEPKTSIVIVVGIYVEPVLDDPPVQEDTPATDG